MKEICVNKVFQLDTLVDAVMLRILSAEEARGLLGLGELDEAEPGAPVALETAEEREAHIMAQLGELTDA